MLELREAEMIAKEEIRHRALMMGISTGDMPSVDLIWNIQQDEHNQACFGDGQGCLQRKCRWRRYCRALDFFADVSLPLAGREENVKVEKEHRTTKTVVEITSAEKATAALEVCGSAPGTAACSAAGRELSSPDRQSATSQRRKL